jgi:LUD domain
MHGIPEWEELRSLASAIKEHTLTRLDEYLDQFEAKARANGIHVHWARDAAEHNSIVHGILGDHGAKSLGRIKDRRMIMHPSASSRRSVTAWSMPLTPRSSIRATLPLSLIVLIPWGRLV